MDNAAIGIGEDRYPFILCKINGGLFCVNSEHISTIMQLPAYESLPAAPPEIMGLFPHRGGFVKMFNVRVGLGKPPLREEFDAFGDMLDARKQDPYQLGKRAGTVYKRG